MTHTPPRPLACDGRSSQPRTRVHRRRRLLVAFVLAVAVFVLWNLGGLLVSQLRPAAAGAAADEPAAAPSFVVVQPGDTIWSIAAELAGDDDPRPIVDDLVERNGGAVLLVGQRLEVPSG